MVQYIKDEIDRLIMQLRFDQQTDGSWHYPFEIGITPDAFMIILLKTLDIQDEAFIQSLTERILSRQDENGAWKLYHDEQDGNVSLTIEAYYALLLSGLHQEKDEHMKKAQQFIMTKGGLSEANLFTKMMLTLTGQLKWPLIFPIPIEAVLLPPSFPVSMYDLSMYSRSNILPFLLCSDRKFQMNIDSAPNLKDLLSSRFDDPWQEFRGEEGRAFVSMICSGVKNLIGLPSHLHKMAVSGIKNYMLERTEQDGTLYNFFSATFFMIFALLSQGHSKKDPIILKAVEGLRAMSTSIDGQLHIQFTRPEIWNTALITYALQEAGLEIDDPSVQKANQYLLARQQVKYGDWRLHNPNTLPGGWGFSDGNTINPDIDDTTAALRSIYPATSLVPSVKGAYHRGLSYVLSTQNDDGGFPAFEKNVDSKWLQLLPIENAKYMLTDPSTPDLTGRALEFIGNFSKRNKTTGSTRRAVKWLLQAQEKNGSWYGRWGICYIYGTWAALTGLRAVGEVSNHPAIQKAVKWLLSIQNEDGGWGESCTSDFRKKYHSLSASNLTQTAWAVDALISISPTPTPAIDKGIAYLIHEGQRPNWTNDYPVGQGLPGYVYMHYHSYRYIFPLLALSHYQRKYLHK
ncbi:squalene--hopene cyclase [Bacillus cihuensis]|uniref:squalene--hopene cyclase n=1 Tax=Bacillus cihuensis TaxID=1208599 RepID=UPI000408C8A3|nr:squalene--hopene cyclase [Bacillus cihuensis]